MSPPEGPKRNVKAHNPSAESVEVLQELKESLMPMMKQLSSSQKDKAGGKKDKAGKGNADKQADKENASSGNNARDERAKRRAGSRNNSAPNSEDEDEEVDVSDAVADKKARRLSAAAEDAVGQAKDAVAGGDASSMAEVRKVLEDVCDAEPDAKSNPAVQAAYVALDNMEAEEVEAISAESALLYKEQQNLVREIARSKHALKLAAVRLAWYDAAPDHVEKEDEVPGEDNVGGGKEALDELISRQELEETNLARLRQELKDNKAAVEGLQAEIPERVVSSNRLSQLKLVVKHQQAATDAMRFKQQARSVGGLMQEVLSAWESAIPEELSALLLDVFDLPGTAKPNASIDTQRRGALDTKRGTDGEAMPTPKTKKMKKTVPKARPRDEDSPRDDKEVGDESEEDESDEEEEVDHAPHVLGADGNATPWRTLGSLAQKAAKNADDASDDGDDDEEDDEEDEDDEVPKEVVKKAQAELKDARSKRISVMKFVEEAATPKPRKASSKTGKKAKAEAKAETPETADEEDATPREEKKKREKRSSSAAREPLSDRSDRSDRVKGKEAKPRKAKAKAK